MFEFHKKTFPFTLLCSLMLITMLILSMPVTASASSSGFSSSDTIFSSSKDTSVDSANNTNNIKLSSRSLKIVKGKSAQLKVLNMPANYSISYSSSNKSIAKVSSKGVVSGVKNGETTITVKVRYKERTVRKMTCSIEVGPAAISIVIPKSKITLKVGKTHYLNYILKASNTVEVPTFKSSNKKVATVSKNGMITTHAAGKTVITATINSGKSDSITITVKKKSS